MKSYKVISLTLTLSLTPCCTPIQEKNKNVEISYSEILCSDQIERLYNESVTISNDITFITSDKKQKNRSDLFKDKTFVICYSTFGCNDCINFTLKSIQNRNDITDKTILLIKNTPLRDLYILKKTLHVKEVCKIDSLPFPFDETDMPYCFTINKEGNTSSFFIPRKEIPKQMNTYLNFIEHVLSKTST